MKKGHFILILLGVILGLGLYFAPKQLESEQVDTSAMLLNQKIDKAIALVNAGEQPMQGIMLLREVLEEDPENSRAHFQLGIFSIQSKQYDKAVDRFEKVLKQNPEDFDAHYYLGYAYLNLESFEKARESFMLFAENTQEVERKKEVNQIINELKNL